MDVLGVTVHEISAPELRSNLDFILTLGIFEPPVIQIPDFMKILLSLSQTTTQNLDGIAVVVCEISTHELRSSLAFILSLRTKSKAIA